MLTTLDLEAGVKVKSTLAKDLHAMTFYGLISHFNALEATIIGEISGLFSILTPLDLEAGVKVQICPLQKVCRL